MPARDKPLDKVKHGVTGLLYGYPHCASAPARRVKWIPAIPDDEEVETIQDKLSDIKEGIDEETAANADFSFLGLLKWSKAHRILPAVGIFLAQQSTGATALSGLFRSSILCSDIRLVCLRLLLW